MIGAGPRLRYAFASGRVRVLQGRLISRSRFNRLIAGENLDEIIAALSETHYGPGLREVSDLDGVEQFLDGKLNEAYRLIEESNLPPELSAWFRSRHDFINLRVLIKSGLGREDHARLTGLGIISPDVAESLVKSHTFSGFPTELAAAAQAALAAYNQAKDFDIIDIVLDRRHFQHLTELAARIGAQWIINYTRMLADIANARIVIRGRAQNRGLSFIASRLVPGGRLNEREWEAVSVGGSPGGLLIKALPPEAVNSRLAAWAAKDPGPREFDLLADAVTRNYLMDADKIAFGPEPVFAYVATRELETKLLRMIIIGRVNGVAPEVLRPRVGRILE